MRRYKAKCVKTRSLQEWVGHFEPKFQEEGVVPGEYFFGFYKTRHILLSNGANCILLRAVVLTQYRRVTDRQTDGQTDRRTDRQTDGIAVANTAFAMHCARCKKEKFAFEPPFGRLRGNVRTSSIARWNWKARVRLPIRHN